MILYDIFTCYLAYKNAALLPRSGPLSFGICLPVLDKSDPAILVRLVERDIVNDVIGGIHFALVNFFLTGDLGLVLQQ